MPDEKTVLSGTTLPAKSRDCGSGTKAEISPLEALGALTQLVSMARDAYTIQQTERTKREQIRAYRDTEIVRVKAAEAALRDYFDRHYQERSMVHRRMLNNLDRAVETGDIAAIPAIVNGIVDLARVSPLAAVGDLGDLMRAMRDPDAVVEL